MTHLSFDGVSFGYTQRRLVFDELRHEFGPGATLLLGPNGAGKSTLLALGSSAFAPRSGLVRLGDTVAAGRSLRAFRSRVSWLPQVVRPIPGLTVREQVAYVGWLKGMSKADAWKESEPALGLVGLAEHAGGRPSRLSGGELRRLGVAQTLVHRAAWVLMDEPTAGLDPAQRADFQLLVADLRSRMSLVVSTHQTEDMDATYDAVVVLGEGRVRFSGPIDAFLALGGDRAGGSERVVAAYTRALGSEPVP